jgi:hypothetical protein
MSFKQLGFRVVETGGVSASGARFGRATYITDDAAATVEGTGYFDSADGIFVGLMIEIIAAAATTPVHKTYVVSAISTHVTATLQTATAG